MVKISKEVKDFTWENKMFLVPQEENVVYISYRNDICVYYNEELLTAELISLIKKDNPSLMVTALHISKKGAIVNFEEKR